MIDNQENESTRDIINSNMHIKPARPDGSLLKGEYLHWLSPKHSER